VELTLPKETESPEGTLQLQLAICGIDSLGKPRHDPGQQIEAASATAIAIEE